MDLPWFGGAEPPWKEIAVAVVLVVVVVQVNQVVGRSCKFGIYSMCNQPHPVKERAEVHNPTGNYRSESFGEYGSGSGGQTLGSGLLKQISSNLLWISDLPFVVVVTGSFTVGVRLLTTLTGTPPLEADEAVDICGSSGLEGIRPWEGTEETEGNMLCRSLVNRV